MSGLSLKRTDISSVKQFIEWVAQDLINIGCTVVFDTRTLPASSDHPDVVNGITRIVLNTEPLDLFNDKMPWLISLDDEIYEDEIPLYFTRLGQEDSYERLYKTATSTKTWSGWQRHDFLPDNTHWTYFRISEHNRKPENSTPRHEIRYPKNKWDYFEIHKKHRAQGSLILSTPHLWNNDTQQFDTSIFLNEFGNTEQHYIPGHIRGIFDTSAIDKAKPFSYWLSCTNRGIVLSSSKAGDVKGRENFWFVAQRLIHVKDNVPIGTEGHFTEQSYSPVICHYYSDVEVRDVMDYTYRYKIKKESDEVSKEGSETDWHGVLKAKNWSFYKRVEKRGEPIFSEFNGIITDVGDNYVKIYYNQVGKTMVHEYVEPYNVSKNQNVTEGKIIAYKRPRIRSFSVRDSGNVVPSKHWPTGDHYTADDWDDFNNKTMNSIKQNIQLEEDEFYGVLFPKNMNTIRSQYTEGRIDMIGFTSAGMVNEDNVIDIEVGEVKEARKYIGLYCTGGDEQELDRVGHTEGMRLLMLWQGGGIEEEVGEGGPRGFLDNEPPTGLPS